MEVCEGWAEPLLERIKTRSSCRGGFRWDMRYAWFPLPPYLNQFRGSDWEPFPTPVLQGSCTAVRKSFFNAVGRFDPGLEILGDEHFDLSFNVWITGGRIETKENSRFAKVTVEDVDQFLDTEVNQNTKRKTEQNVRVFQEFLEANLEFREFTVKPPTELSNYLSMFILSVKMKDGGEYEPSSLWSFISSIQRVMKKKGYNKTIDDVEFSKMKETLTLKQKSLKSQGKWNKPKAAVELSDANIEEMNALDKLGPQNPQSLLHSMWFICTMHFGMQTGNECHNLTWGDVVLLTDDDGTEYFQYDSERQTKTRTGADARNMRDTKPRAYAIPQTPEKDPVALYKLYREKRPDAMLSGDTPFFLAINYQKQKSGSWFEKNAMGINTIYDIMKDMKSGTTFEQNERITPFR
ncbi:polypeptide N-acetylgalactosaminyltransferase 14-like [Haliotis rufescens]|uniref:polypeptide N-acetylgalactosaminyltransferase 14-like n=1 Tax=Haliotis rufescens TaxID=6454 RepID=UPI00201F4848|nr:polypeptide N-acetylgalactosaminyltransferase 14-like [Haliotis rufescens]